MVTLYMHLKKLNNQLNELNQQFLDVSVASASNEVVGGGGADSEKLVAIRKQISTLGVYSRLFTDFQNLLKEMQSCKELMQESGEDKEMKKMAEDDLATLTEQMEDLQVEIEDEVVPKRGIDARDVTLEVR